MNHKDLEVEIAKGIASTAYNGMGSSTLALFATMYYIERLGGVPVNLRMAFRAGNFVHGKPASEAIRNAEAKGFIQRDESDLNLLRPTKKLMDLIQILVDMEMPAKMAITQTREFLAEAKAAQGQ